MLDYNVTGHLLACGFTRSLWAIFHTHFGLLRQPLLPPSRFFLHHSWAFLGFTILYSGRLFTTWMACNLPGCLILHCLHPHSSSSSSMLSLAILGLYNSFIRPIMRLIGLCSLLGSFGKSACQGSPPTYPHCTDPVLPPQMALSVSPLSYSKLFQVSHTS